MRKSRLQASLRQGRQVATCERFSTAFGEQTTGDDHCLEIGLDHQVAPHLLTQQHDLGRTTGKTVKLLRQRQSQPAHLGKLPPAFPAEAELAPRSGLTLVETIARLQVARRAVLQHFLFVTELDEHG